MLKCGSSLMLALLLGIPAFAREPKPTPADKVLFDFEDVAEVKAWSNLELPGAGDKEPAAKIERSTDNATSGKHSLNITFAGGRWPTLTTTRLPGDWTAWATFKADVTASRRCVVGFTVLQEKSKRGGGWEAGVSRWTKTAFLQPGKNQIAAPLRASYGSTIRPEQGKVVRLELFMYNPHEGESIYVDNIRLLTAKEPVVPPRGYPYDKAGELKYLSNFCTTEYKLKDVKVILLTRNSALVTYEAHYKVRPTGSQTIIEDTTSHRTAAWVQRNSNWWRVYVEDRIAQ